MTRQTPRGGRRPILSMIGLVAVTLVLSGVILNNAPVPFGWIGLLGCALGVTLMFVDRSRRVVWFNVAFVCLALAGTEFLLSREDPSRTRGDWDCSGSGSFFRDDEVLGYAPRPGVECSVTGYVDGEQIYEATYTIDEHGLRTTPEPAAASRGSILFFGGSFTFGEGVNDSETLPYFTAVKVGEAYAVYNFGFHGYGPHQMLAALEFGIVDDVVASEPRYVIYQGIPAHTRRVAGFTSWDLRGPKYVLTDSGSVTFAGPFHEGWRLKVLLKLRRSNLFSFLEQGLLWRVRQPQVDLYLAIVDRSRQIVEQRYDGAEFHVVFWDHEDDPWTDEILDGLSERGIPVHRVTDILPEIVTDESSFILHEENRHPNPLAYDRIADYIAREIVGVPGPPESRTTPGGAEPVSP